MDSCYHNLWHHSFNPSRHQHHTHNPNWRLAFTYLYANSASRSKTCGGQNRMLHHLTLDIGCGKNKRGDIGIDYSRDSNADIIADAHFLPFKNEVFNKVVSYTSFEHSPNPLQFLIEQYRVLREKGTVLCETDNAQYYRWSTQKFGATNPHPEICNDHYAIFFPKHVLRLMEMAGFRGLDFRYKRRNSKFDLMALMFIRLKFWQEASLFARFIVTGVKSSKKVKK